MKREKVIHYVIKAGNEPNPDIVSEARAEALMSIVRRSANPQKTYEMFLRMLENQCKQEELEQTALT